MGIDKIAIVRKAKIGRKVIFGNKIGDKVVSLNECLSGVSQIVGIQKIGLQKINKTIKSQSNDIRDSENSSRCARLMIRDIKRKSNWFRDISKVKKKVKSDESKIMGKSLSLR